MIGSFSVRYRIEAYITPLVAADDTEHNTLGSFSPSIYKIDAVLFYFSLLNAKLPSTSQRYDNSSMLAVDLHRIATESTSRRRDFFAYDDDADTFTGLHEEPSDS